MGEMAELLLQCRCVDRRSVAERGIEDRMQGLKELGEVALLGKRLP